MERIFKIRCSQIGAIMGNAKKAGELSATCKTYLHKWYANDKEDITSKYFEKGNLCEAESLQMAADVLNFGFIDKNEEQRENEYFIGTPDAVLNDYIIDVKSVWNNETLQRRITDGYDEEYKYQLQGYMNLFGKEKAILFYALLDTPEEVNYGKAIEFNLPIEERWIAYQFKYNQTTIDEIIERVKQCREYLNQYDKQIKSKLGILQCID